MWDVVQEAIRVTATVIAEACNGLLEFLQRVRGPDNGGSKRPPFRVQLREAVQQLDTIDWLVPPMLQGKK